MKPIKDAPLDGSKILGYADGEFAVVYWTGEYWNLAVCGAFAENGEWTPTHWAPLPNPPNPEVLVPRAPRGNEQPVVGTLNSGGDK